MIELKRLLKRKIPILVKVKRILYKMILREKLEFLELHMVESCNLNCKGCTSFSNISKEADFIDARILAIRLHKLSEIFYVKKLRLLGGEPLLHPDIINVLKAAREGLPDSYIELVTNGILLNTMSKDFYETCREYNIRIYISFYPVLKNKDILEKKLSSYNVKYEFSPMIFTFSANLNPKGNSDKKETYKNCRYAYYKTLKNDNIYNCPICAYINQYNEFFNKKIPVGRGINIYNNSGKQIRSYFRNPEETCKYCTIFTRYMNWEHSNTPEETDWYGEDVT